MQEEQRTATLGQGSGIGFSPLGPQGATMTAVEAMQEVRGARSTS